MTDIRSRRADWYQYLMDLLDAVNEEWKIAIRERNTAEILSKNEDLKLRPKGRVESFPLVTSVNVRWRF